MFDNGKLYMNVFGEMMFLVNMLKYYVGFVDKVGGKIIFVGKWRCLQYILQRLRILMIFFLMVI